jgi:hypothetical protein
MSGIKGAALQAATGAVAELGAAAIAARVPFVAQNWWATPAGLALLGILMKRRQRLRGLGDAMLGAAGYAGAQNYQLARAIGVTAGETAALYDGTSDAGMLVGGDFAPLSDYNNPTSSRYVAEGTPAGSVDAAMAL